MPLTAKDAARLVSCHPRTLRKAIRSGRVPALFVGRVWLVRPEDVEAWAAERLAARGGRSEWRGRPRKVHPVEAASL